MVNKIVNKKLLKRANSLEKGLNIQEKYNRIDCLEIACALSVLDNKNLQSTVCTFFGDINAVCNSNDIKDCHRIKGDITIIIFSSRRKSSEVLNKKKKLKNLDIRNYALNDGSNMYVFSPKPLLLLLQIMGKMHTINVILPFKESEHDKLIIITHDKEFW